MWIRLLCAVTCGAIVPLGIWAERIMTMMACSKMANLRIFAMPPLRIRLRMEAASA